MNRRPIIQLRLKAIDVACEILGWLLIVGHWVFTVAAYTALPNTVPIHFNGAGEADRMGDKAFLFFLPFISTALAIGLTVLNKYPHWFNYLSPITSSNAQEEYTRATRLLRVVKISIVIVFALITVLSVRSATKATSGIGAWVLPLALMLVGAPIVVYIGLALRAARKQS